MPTRLARVQVHVGHFVRRDNRAGQADWTNLYVKGLPTSWDDAKLREEFEKHGAVTSCKVQVAAAPAAPAEGEESKEKDKDGKEKEKEKPAEPKSRGFGFVNFEEHDAAVKAIEALNGTVSFVLAVFFIFHLEEWGPRARGGWMRAFCPDCRDPYSVLQFLLGVGACSFF